MNKEIFFIKRKHLLGGFITLCLLLFKADVQAKDDHPLDKFFNDRRTEIEKISDDPQLMGKYILSQTDVNVRFKEGKTFLHYASPKNYRDIVKLLLERGADINATDNDKRTPLHEAMSYKAFEVVRFLVAKGANVNMEGSCKALLTGAYFDVKAVVCREFTGCGCVFPFDNLGACKKVCEE